MSECNCDACGEPIKEGDAVLSLSFGHAQKNEYNPEDMENSMTGNEYFIHADCYWEGVIV